MNYYEISEETARTAHSMVHMSDYKPGSATDGYRAAVDEAAALVASKKAEVSPFYHDKLDALLDRYARRLAEWTNAHNRNQASYPSQFISGAGNFNMRKHNKQMAREDTLWKEYDEIKGILSKIKSVGTGPVDLADPHAREILTEQLAAYQKSLDDAKAANAFYRKNKTLDGCPGITPKEKAWLTSPGRIRQRRRNTPCALWLPVPGLRAAEPSGLHQARRRPSGRVGQAAGAAGPAHRKREVRRRRDRPQPGGRPAPNHLRREARRGDPQRP